MAGYEIEVPIVLEVELSKIGHTRRHLGIDMGIESARSVTRKNREVTVS